jgi:excisionase family DNA binding protein
MLERQILAIREVAEACAGDATIRAAIARGEIAAVRIGKHVRVPTTELQRLLGR